MAQNNKLQLLRKNAKYLLVIAGGIFLFFILVALIVQDGDPAQLVSQSFFKQSPLPVGTAIPAVNRPPDSVLPISVEPNYPFVPFAIDSGYQQVLNDEDQSKFYERISYVKGENKHYVVTLVPIFEKTDINEFSIKYLNSVQSNLVLINKDSVSDYPAVEYASTTPDNKRYLLYVFIKTPTYIHVLALNDTYPEAEDERPSFEESLRKEMTLFVTNYKLPPLSSFSLEKDW